MDTEDLCAIAHLGFALTVSFFWVALSTNASTASEPGFTGKNIGVSAGATVGTGASSKLDGEEK